MRGDGDDPCPLCGSPLYGWVTLPAEGSPPSLGPGVAPEAVTRVIDRCESCGVGVERGQEVDLAAELRAVSSAAGDGSLEIGCANRASLQAGLAGDGWAPVDRLPGRLALTPRALALLAERNGYRLVGPSFPPLARGQGWMWQTLLNALTFHNNFARDLRTDRVRPSGARGGFAYAIDLVVTILAAPLVALVAFPFETIAAALNRGGWMEARAEPVSVAPEPGAG